MNRITLLLIMGFIACNTSTNSKSAEEKIASDTMTIANSGSPKPTNPDGNWERPGTFDNATLIITNSNTTSFNFSFSAASGGHTGELKGMANLENDNAVFIDTSKFTDCKLQFQLFKDSILVTESGGNCGAGMGVTYSGTYYSSAALPKKDNTISGVSVLENAAANELLKEVTGKHYQLFQESSQLVNNEEESLDGPGLKVQTAGVRGLFTLMENIVMTDESGHIWAAVIDDQRLRYFTNVATDKNKLPLTIEKWRERFKDYKIIYEK